MRGDEVGGWALVLGLVLVLGLEFERGEVGKEEAEMRGRGRMQSARAERNFMFNLRSMSSLRLGFSWLVNTFDSELTYTTSTTATTRTRVTAINTNLKY